MNIFFRYTLVLSCLWVTGACRKDGVEAGYKGEVAIGMASTLIPGATGDSAMISFGTRPAAQTDSSLHIAVRITGAMSAANRTFFITVTDSLTTALADEYVLPATFVLPANSIETSFPLILKRTSRLKTMNARLTLSVKENENFVRGPINGRFSPTVKIIWNDRLIKPATWSASFGTYSDKKYQVIIEQTGYTEFNVHISIIYQILFTVQKYVSEYNAANPDAPLRDENGALVSYP
ncbi:MAG TPA: DUF4843 domain-containing protein [Chitinophaga sp.]|nr:DUF4843 domain-containing protein [Chitinophaga sp.]